MSSTAPDSESIPRVPRAVRWRPCLRRNSGLAWLGGLTAGVGLLLATLQRIEGRDATAVIYLFLPGLIVLGYWYRSALRLRILLREGRSTRAEVLAVRSPVLAGSRCLSVRYRYHDQNRQQQEASHCLRQISVLGQELLEGRSQVAVVHDLAQTRYSRIVSAADFAEPGQVTAP